jgi:hypothetical protein
MMSHTRSGCSQFSIPACLLPILGVPLEFRVKPPGQLQQGRKCEIPVARVSRDSELEVPPPTVADGRRRKRLTTKLPEHKRDRIGHQAPVTEVRAAYGTPGAKGTGNKGDIELVHPVLRLLFLPAGPGTTAASYNRPACAS